MIGSFWNLCRACPSMPVDKLHSEYRSTYRWHEYTGPRQEVVRRPPQTNIPEKNNDISASRNHDEDFQTDSLPKQEPAMPRRKKYPDLAYRHHEFLSEERHGPEWRSSRRSKSEGPARGCAGGAGVGRGGGAQRGAGGLGDGERRRESDPDMENTANTGHTSRRDAAGSTPRKSHSMGALKARAQANAMVHKNRIDMENRDASELEPLVGSQEKPKQESHSEYQKKFRPFSQYEYSGVTFTTKENQKPIADEADNNATIVDNEDGVWYKEVVELRKKAGEYKHREWGSDLTPDRVHDIYNKQIELWDQVSRRSSLSALSLASMTHKTYTKEEKEDNNRKTSPTKAHRNAENSARMIRDIIKHHLEKTTGGSEYEGLIWSPTRDKLEPTIPRKDDDSRGSQKSSPKKSSPMKSSSLKRANQKAKQVRSQSVGPTPETNVEKRSPKRQSRSTTAKDGRKSSNETPSNKRPRPSSLNTTVSSRSKSSPVVTKNEDDRLAKPLQNHNKSQSVDSSKNNQKVATKDRKGSKEADQATENIPSVAKDTATHEEHDSITYEPIIKSPPEPTRVKSPEQIIMRSPDPVNWTVPLDTGKTFTVTQNVREGDIAIRPHSEVKAWTPPVEVPPPVAQSAPPTLIEETKAHVGFS